MKARFMMNNNENRPARQAEMSQDMIMVSGDLKSGMEK